MGELMMGRPLFNGSTPKEQLALIVAQLGAPSADAVDHNASAFGRSLLPQAAGAVEGSDSPYTWAGAFVCSCVRLACRHERVGPSHRLGVLSTVCTRFSHELTRPRASPEHSVTPLP